MYKGVNNNKTIMGILKKTKIQKRIIKIIMKLHKLKIMKIKRAF